MPEIKRKKSDAPIKEKKEKKAKTAKEPEVEAIAVPDAKTDKKKSKSSKTADAETPVVVERRTSERRRPKAVDVIDDAPVQVQPVSKKSKKGDIAPATEEQPKKKKAGKIQEVEASPATEIPAKKQKSKSSTTVQAASSTTKTATPVTSTSTSNADPPAEKPKQSKNARRKAERAAATASSDTEAPALVPAEAETKPAGKKRKHAEAEEAPAPTQATMDSSSSKKQKRKAEAEAAPTAVEAAPAPVKKSAAAPAVKEEKKDKRKTKVDKPTSTDEPAPSVKAISNGVVKKLASKKAEAASTKPRRAAAPRKLLVAEDGDEDEEDDEDFAPPADDAEDDDDEAISGSELEENGHLHGFSTDEDSSDDDADMKVDEAPGLDVSQLPTIVKDDATVQRRLAEAKKAAKASGKKGSEEDRGVIYLGRIPHGFYEDQMRAYFTQFGTVTRLRLSRNKKTGRSKHYAFIEFDGLKVAEIVADTMDNYLLLGHILQCRVVPKEEVHPQLWVGANRRYRVVPHDRIARLKHNRKRTAEEVVRAEDRLIQRQDAKRRKLAEAGIEYDFGAVAYKKVEA